MLAERDPDELTTEFRIANRGDRIYLDAGRVRWGHTARRAVQRARQARRAGRDAAARGRSSTTTRCDPHGWTLRTLPAAPRRARRRPVGGHRRARHGPRAGAARRSGSGRGGGWRQPARETFLLVDGENIDATLGVSLLGRRPAPEERPRWDRVRDYARAVWEQPVRGAVLPQRDDPSRCRSSRR